MRYCNINIQDDTRRFKYIIEYQDDAEFKTLPDLHYSVETFGDPLRVDFFESSQITRNDNYWQEHTNREVDPPKDNLTDYIPQENGVPKVNISSVNLYFPTNSVEAYTNNNLYALTVNTWIHGHIVYLGTYIIDRRNALACDRERKFLNTRYFECVNVKFIDPWYLTYSDDWKNFRQQVCGEIEGETELNNTGSVLNFSLYPITWNEDRYIKLDPYIGGQNAINISDSVTDYIGCSIQLQDNDGKIVHSSIQFNESYNTDGVQTYQDFLLYMKETYDVVGDLYLTYNLLVVDNENIYKVISSDPVQTLTYDFNNINFESWDGWKEGLRFILNIDIYTGLTEETREDIMLLRSNTISITQDIMKYFVDSLTVKYIPLDSLDMNNYIINAVNKIEKKIIQVEKPNDNKANIVRPVYYRVHELNNITVHPAVTENICINLDAYKSTVDTFYIQIENVTFVEAARTNSGVIFKVVGANLSGEKGEGTYYLLNQDRELVTTGKYKYEV